MTVLTPSIVAVVMVSGAVAGCLGALLGLGGGVFLVPFLNAWLGLDFKTAAAELDEVVNEFTSNDAHHLDRVLQRLGSWAVGRASGVSVGDATSGFRAFSRDAAMQINVFNPFTYTLETIIQSGNRNLQRKFTP